MVVVDAVDMSEIIQDGQAICMERYIEVEAGGRKFVVNTILENGSWMVIDLMYRSPCLAEVMACGISNVDLSVSVAIRMKIVALLTVEGYL